MQPLHNHAFTESHTLPRDVFFHLQGARRGINWVRSTFPRVGCTESPRRPKLRLRLELLELVGAQHLVENAGAITPRAEQIVRLESFGRQCRRLPRELLRRDLALERRGRAQLGRSPNLPQ